MSRRIDDFEFYVEYDHAVVERYYGRNTDVIIPEQYKGFPVTHIEDYCFEKRHVTTVIGKSIKSVGYGAFEYCSRLTSIDFPVCERICDDVFYDCEKLASVNLPDCEYVGISAFEYCTNLTSVSLPVCKYIGPHAFYGCASLIKRGNYKATEIDLTCRDFHYEIGQWFEEDEAILCEKGFHFVENFYDIFNYYYGELGKDMRIFEVDADEISDEGMIDSEDSKRVCKKIKLVKEIKSYQEIFKE